MKWLCETRFQWFAFPHAAHFGLAKTSPDAPFGEPRRNRRHRSSDATAITAACWGPGKSGQDRRAILMTSR